MIKLGIAISNNQAQVAGETSPTSAPNTQLPTAPNLATVIGFLNGDLNSRIQIGLGGYTTGV